MSKMCKRLKMLIALLCFLSGAWAESITDVQALKLAQQFMTSHKAAKTPGASPQLKSAGKVSGLYLFNVDGGGFVVVSNDDCITPILGFGDSGKLDTQTMPDNMRAWLQGYADEIAWAQKNLETRRTVKMKDGSDVSPSKGSRKVGSHSTANIPPMVTTRWNQNTPYNNLCPEYVSGTNCVTGCVATAMAQVMKYHECPAADTFTSAIPGYTGSGYGNQSAGLPSTTFQWGDMLNSYSGGYTTAQANAVAKLMLYCGYSVKMEYGPSSGAYTEDVAIALRNYFGYAQTTQYISRSSYSYANWTDLIYHELSEGRPVIYGGASMGGGHEFVCDGYMYEDGTDYFHINWGWGGTSDYYFVLSILNPYEQGIGGSSSDDGFHFGQDAVIGIQPLNGTGTVADIPANDYNSLTLNSITSEYSFAHVGAPVNIILNITNNNPTYDYDGDIWLAERIWQTGTTGNDYLINGQTYVIPAGETVECVVPFTPEQEGDYELCFYYLDTEGVFINNGGTVTVSAYDDLTNKYVPVYGFYCDDYSRSQFIIPAADLADMAGASVSGLTFQSSNSSVSWGDAKFDVYLSEVSTTTISTLKDWSTLEKVYSGSLSISQNKMTIIFDEPYLYEGGNLLVGINQTVSGTYKSCNWYGYEATGASLGGYGTNISQQNFIPYTTFDYEFSNNDVEAPETITATEVTAHGATLSWTGGTGLYNVEYKETADNDWMPATTNTELTSWQLTELEQHTDYQARVQSVDGENVSRWKTVSFSTPYSCPAPTALTCTAHTANTATLTWTENGTATQWEICVDDNLNSLTTVTGTPVCTLTGLTPETMHTAKVRAANSDDDKSLWTEAISFETTEKLIIGSATEVNNNLPTNAYYNYALTQQIYTVDEIGEAGALKSIDFYSTSSDRERNLDIYMLSTDKSSFSNATDWFSVTASDLVFSGTVNFTQNAWTTIPLDEYFDYDGLSNVVVIVDDNTGGYDSSASFRVFNAPKQALYVYNDYTDYDPANPSFTGALLSVKNQIRLLKGEKPLVARPKDLDIAYTGGSTATVSWTSSLTGFDIEVNSNLIEDVTNPYTLTGLEYATTYDVKVRAKDGDHVSDWTGPVSFTTDLCAPEQMCTITFNLTDSYGDGWNGCAIKVEDVLTGKEIGSVTNTTNNHSQAPITDTVILPVPHDRDIRFAWVKGNYGNECSWKVYDVNGSIIFSGQGTTSMATGTVLYTYHVDCNDADENPVPADITADLMADGATLTWTGNGDSYNVQYRTEGGEWQDVVPAPTDAIATLSGLATNNGYEYRIQSVKGYFTSGWSESGAFALITLQDDADNTTLLAGNDGKLAHVTLGGRTLYKDGTWNTLCLPFMITPKLIETSDLANADIRTLNSASYNGKKLKLNFAVESGTDDINSGTPLIVKWTKDADYVDDNAHNIWQPAFANVTISQTMNDKVCDLANEKSISFKGTYKKLAYSETTTSILFLGANNTLFYPLEGATIGSHRAYFELTGFTAVGDGEGARFILDFGDDIDGTTTSVDEGLNIEGKSDVWYSLDGVKLDSKPKRKGVYLQNGHKVIIK